VLAKSGIQEFRPEASFTFKVAPTHFNLFIARLQSVFGNEGTMDINSDLLQVSLTIPQEKKQEVTGFAEGAKKRGWLLAFSAKSD